MAKQESFVLQLGTLHNFREDVTSDFDAQLGTIIADCKKRPGCPKARTLTVKIEAKPNQQDSADVDVGIVVSSKIPAADHGKRRARATTRNQLVLDFEEPDAVSEDE